MATAVAPQQAATAAFQQTGWIFWEGNSNQLWQDVGCDGHGVAKKKPIGSGGGKTWAVMATA